MSTSSTGPVIDPKSTHVTEMPPMVVTTEGIPAKEHLEAPPAAERTSHRTMWIALALAGVIAFAFGVIVYTFLNPAPVPTAHMGLSDSAWSEYRAGERASIALAGPGTADWQSYRPGERASIVTSGPGSVDWQTYRGGERQTA